MKGRVWHIDAAGCALFVLASLWVLRVSQGQAADAALVYGHNVDSGGIEYAIVVLYLVPVAFLFGAAAVAGRRAWRQWRCLHWLAVLAAVCPAAFEVMAALIR